MPTDWTQEFLKQAHVGEQRQQEFSDTYRKQRIHDYTTLGQEVQKVLTTGQVLDKTSGQMRPLTDQEKAQLGQVSQHVQDYIQKLYNLQIDPMSGMLDEDPIHKLTDKLHLTKPPAQPMAEGGKTPGQQIQDLNQMRQDFQTQYGGGMLTPEEQRKAAKVEAKIEPPAVAPKTGGSDFSKFLTAYAQKLDMDPSELSPEQIEQARRDWQGAGRADKEDWVNDPNSSTGVSRRTRDASGKVTGYVRDVIPPRQAVITETVTTDPFGVTSTTIRKPVYPGKKADTSQPSKVPSGKPTAQAKPAGQQKKDVKALSESGVDAQGHIPDSAKVNPYLREAANNLLDGMDIAKLPIPARDRAAAEQLAKKYGWKGQGFLLPADQMRLKEAETFLQKMAESPSMSVLDESWWSQLAITAQAPDPSRAGEGLFARIFTKAGAQAMTDQQAEFMRLYRSMVGTISGMSTLVRSGRPTEAQINRLVAELPNPYNTKNSTDAKARLQRVQLEIDIARDKGIFRSDAEMFTGPEFSKPHTMTDDDFLMKVGKQK